MSTPQRQEQLKKFDSTHLRPFTIDSSPITHAVPHSNSLPSSLDSNSGVPKGASTSNIPIQQNTVSQGLLSISVEESGISTLALATLHGIWAKAEEYLKSERDMLPAPGCNLQAMMVASKSAKIPPYVSLGLNGQYTCDANCLQW